MTLKTQTIATSEQAIFIGPATLVASKSAPGEWNVVEGGRCSCKGFQYRGTCRHLAVAAQAAENDRLSAAPVAQVPDAMYPSTCPPSKESWLPEPEAPALFGRCAREAEGYRTGRIS